jgi:hypothetical protein
MLPHYFFWTLLLSVFGYALWHGRSDERMAAGVCLLASIATRFAISPLTERYSNVEIGLLLIDGAVLLAFVAIAIRSNRFWPLWIAGLQLTSSLSHLMKVVEVDLVPRAYAAAAVFWSYPILLIIVVGTWRAHQRGRQDQPSIAYSS